MNSWCFWNRPPIDHRHVPKYLTVCVLKRHTHIADGPGCSQFLLLGINLKNPVRKMHQLGCVDHALTGSSCDIHLIVSDPLAIHPERQGPQTTSIGEVFRDPGSVRAESFGQVLDQCGEKLLSSFRCSTFENRP